MTQARRKAELVGRLAAVRERTLRLFDQVPDDFLARRVHDFYSPVGWHFGHIARTEEHWVLAQASGRPALDSGLGFLFADLPENPKENRVNLPSRAAIAAYMLEVRGRVLDALRRADLACEAPLLAGGYGWEFALQHECQHQETIAELLALIRQARGEAAAELRFPAWRRGVETTFAAVPGGEGPMGSDAPDAYDNERARHTVKVPAFELARHPVSAFDWTEFIADGGYRTESLWTSEGWAWRAAGRIERPEFWRPGLRAADGPAGVRAIDPDEPVASLSWFEADAFARWRGARLPSEAEWEFAAGAGTYPWGEAPPDPARAANALRAWGPAPAGGRPAGASRHGVEDLAGNVWEWTASPFLPYPGFAAFPYDGYSKDHMCGAHRVCRGGSFATADPILRKTFRNWYVPSYRQGFLGMRLARGGSA